MAKNSIQGKVSFVNHEKNYVMIDYEVNGKKKNIRGAIKLPGSKVAEQIDPHNFMMGDVVSFQVGRADKSDKMVATHINFLYNNALNNLIDKAQTINQFKGYLKLSDEKFYVKELESYLFFPLQISPFQQLPAADELNEQVIFSFNIPKNKEKISAELLHPKYIPEYYKAQKLFKEEKTIQATINAIKPHSIYLNIFGDAIQAKIPNDGENYKIGEELEVRITFVGPKKIVVEKV